MSEPFGDKEMKEMKDENAAAAGESVLVVMNGTFGIAFRRGPTPETSDVLVFTPRISDHCCRINNVDFKGRFSLEGVRSSSYRTLFEYNLDNRVFALDLLRYPALPNVKPYGWIHLKYPNRIVPHRLMHVAFRDGSTPGPHGSAVPGALVMEYTAAKGGPRVTFPRGGTIRPRTFAERKCYFLFAGATDAAEEDPYLMHVRASWRQFAAHCSGLSCELFSVTECECDKDAKDQFGVSDKAIEEVHPCGPVEVHAANCKTPQTMLLNGTMTSINWP
jgi:hypothetical protein